MNLLYGSVRSGFEGLESLKRITPLLSLRTFGRVGVGRVGVGWVGVGWVGVGWVGVGWVGLHKILGR